MNTLSLSSRALSYVDSYHQRRQALFLTQLESHLQEPTWRQYVWLSKDVITQCSCLLMIEASFAFIAVASLVESVVQLYLAAFVNEQRHLRMMLSCFITCGCAIVDFYIGFPFQKIVTEEVILGVIDTIRGAIFSAPWDTIDAETQTNGAEFILEDILGDADDKTIRSFFDSDAGFFHYLGAKAYFIYLFGSKRGEAIPDFITHHDDEEGILNGTDSPQKKLIQTKRQLIKLSEELAVSKKPEDKLVLQELETIFRSVDAVNDPESLSPQPQPQTLAILNDLKKLGSEELQSSKLATSCCEEALNEFPSRYPSRIPDDLDSDSDVDS